MIKNLEDKLKQFPALYREYLVTKLDICLDLYREEILDPQDLAQLLMEFYQLLSSENERLSTKKI
jgi:hypothetical protein